MDGSDKIAIGRDETRDVVQELIDGYRYGKLSAEEACRKAEDLLRSYHIFCGKDEDLKRTVEEILPETVRAFRETEDNKQRMLAFWKGLKDCDHLLYFGRTFTEEIEEYLKDGMERADPVEYTDRYLEVEPEMERLVREEIGEGGYLGFCHRYWGAKKRILKEQFGIDWKSPSDRFPGVMFD